MLSKFPFVFFLIQFQGVPDDGDALPERPSEPPCAVRYIPVKAY